MPVEFSEKVSRRAFEIWQREGQPEGQDLAHWLRAEAELTAPAAVVEALPPEILPDAAPKKPAAKKPVAAKAPAKPKASAKATV